MIKAVLVDDERLVLDLLNKVIREASGISIMGSFTDPEEALIQIPQLDADVLFLDVDMPEMSGLELAARLMESPNTKELSIVFVTAYEQYAIRAFELNAIHYILKPVDVQSVDEIVSRVYKKKGLDVPKLPDQGELYFFGNPHLRIEGSPSSFLTPKIEELLALLVLHQDKGISKWRIIDELWEESSVEKSQQNLHTMMFRLKQSLRNAGIQLHIRSKNGIYTVDAKDVYCDFREFDRLAACKQPTRRETIAAYEQAISLYQGDLLDGKDYLWCIPIREKYYRTFVELVAAVFQYATEQGEVSRLKQLRQRVEGLLLEEDRMWWPYKAR
ncbi:SARP family transcriptional regulator [Paenibacillus algicola]|uniref:SARP family transcriptional regulator n=1 Tax=Paenibacillus algicola TaxID=2565926 RepID=A0A4P8XN89_9BACL|nr:response regulator [Paenibacillus algicola]QCT04028.1 SARP family transcriptional regulator [Paenibacillus algicola]